MSLARPQRAPDPEHGAWLVFRLGPHRLCASARDVEGIIEPPPLTRLPGMPAGVIGVFPFRDEFALAVSLARKLGVRADADPASGSYVVARVAQKVAGFQVDEAQEVLEPAGATWHALPSMLGDALFDGFAVRDGELILRTTFEALLDAKPGVDLTAARARAEAMAPAPGPKPARATAPAPAPAPTPGPRIETKPAAAPAAKRSPPPTPVPIRPKATVKPALAPARLAKPAMPPRAARLAPPPPAPVEIVETETIEREIESVEAPAPEVAKAPAAAPTPAPIAEKAGAPAFVAPASARPAPAAAPVPAPRFERATASARGGEPEARESNAGVYVSLAIAAAALIALGVWLWPESVPVPKSAPAPAGAKPEPRIEARSGPLPEPSPAAAPSAPPAPVQVLVDSPRLSVTVERAPAKAPSAAAPDTFAHVVVRGDTLWAIARRYLGDPFRYPELAKLSGIRNPDLIHPGDIVRIRRK